MDRNDGAGAVLLLPTPPPPPHLVVHGFAPLRPLVPHPHPIRTRCVPFSLPPPPAVVFTSPTMAVAVRVRPEVRDVWAGNLREELAHIQRLLPRYPCVCIDTEFPGTVYDDGTPRHLRTPQETYALVKLNVDDLQLLQLGITLFGAAGRCPVAWQFNFRGFDARRDPHAPASIAMLRDQGMDFDALRDFGIDAGVFAGEFFRAGLGCGRLTWVAFSGSYDFAYLAKVLTGGRPMPAILDEFLDLVRALFGPAVFDVKHIARFCGDGMRGGLDKMAAELGVERAAGRAHSAGSDSLLTCDVMRVMVDRFFTDENVLVHAGAIEYLVQVVVS